ncbi:MAG: hypothetical protein ABEJ65_06260 [bacterium]
MSKKVLSIASIMVVSVFLVAGCAMHEHPGEEHPGEQNETHEEHPGEGQEHSGKKMEGHKEETFTKKEVRTAILNHVKQKQSKNGGTFPMYDEKLEKTWKTSFDKLHPVRVMERGGEKIYFACSNFTVQENSNYDTLDLDFWMKPNAQGSLSVYKSKVHKVDGDPRFTYRDNRIVYLNG